MSSAMPCAFSAAMSTITTSANSLTAIARATVAPTLPAPPTTVTLRFIRVSPMTKRVLVRRTVSHVANHRGRELGRLEFGRALNQPGEVVRHLFGHDRLLERS